MYSNIVIYINSVTGKLETSQTIPAHPPSQGSYQLNHSSRNTHGMFVDKTLHFFVLDETMFLFGPNQVLVDQFLLTFCWWTSKISTFHFSWLEKSLPREVPFLPQENTPPFPTPQRLRPATEAMLQHHAIYPILHLPCAATDAPPHDMTRKRHRQRHYAAA